MSMGNVVLSVKNLGKSYRLGQIGTGTLAWDLERYYAKLRGKKDPFEIIGEETENSKGRGEIIWSLDDVSFDISRGEAVAVIGKNGAGKSTLLKVLSRVTGPTKGSISYDGRISSLLEVGTGFHPELTGIENIFLNGSILGMRRFEIKKRIDDIIDFAGIRKYIDTPVKRYSSGMYVRLAFSVAAHLESDILLVDEVLAVGDIEFQKRCLNKMDDVTSKEGKTVIFVSHSMGAVQTLCSRGILLESGRVLFDGEIESTVEKYLEVSNKRKFYEVLKSIESPLQVLSVKAFQENSMIENFLVDYAINIEFRYMIQDYNPSYGIAFMVKKDGVYLFTTMFHSNTSPLFSKKNGEFLIKGIIKPNVLKEGSYSIDLLVGVPKSNPIQKIVDCVAFDMSLSHVDRNTSSFAKERLGSMAYEMMWEE